MDINTIYHFIFENDLCTLFSTCTILVIFIIIILHIRQDTNLFAAFMSALVPTAIILFILSCCCASYTVEYQQGYDDYPNPETYDNISNLSSYTTQPIPENTSLYIRGWDKAKEDDYTNRLKLIANNIT